MTRRHCFNHTHLIPVATGSNLCHACRKQAAVIELALRIARSKTRAIEVHV